MAITKSQTNIGTGTWQSGSTTAAGTSLAVATTADYADCVYITITNTAGGATYTAGANFYIQQSPDGSTWFSGPTFTAGLTASGVYSWQIALDPTCEKVQIVWALGTGTSSPTWSIGIILGQVTAV